MKNVLVLGAGLVAKPLVRCLLDQPDFHIKVASRTVSKAEALVDNHPRGETEALNVKDSAQLENLISKADVTISLVPYTYHVTVAEFCIKHRKHMVTTSYVSEAMNALNSKAKEVGVLLLNELGLDPGIDHMSAMKIIHEVQNKGGEIVSFESNCGGLPAPEANDNPFGYKFSWSPRGVVMAGRNAAHYLKDGKEVKIVGEDLFDNHWTTPVEELGEFEVYPNRDSMPYVDLYGIQSTKTMFRGTFRNIGWCKTLKKIVELGYLGDEEMSGLGNMSFADLTRKLYNITTNNLKAGIAKFLNIDQDSDIMQRIEWLGLLCDDKLPMDNGSPLDILTVRMLEKMPYKPDERDMIILVHEFLAEYPKENKKEAITSTLIDYGIPNGDSSMSRTVGLPAAIGTKLILTGKIAMTGVHIPVSPEIYKPVLAELEKQGIICKEKAEIVY